MGIALRLETMFGRAVENSRRCDADYWNLCRVGCNADEYTLCWRLAVDRVAGT